MTHADEQRAELAAQSEHYTKHPREDAKPNADDSTPNWELEYRKLARQVALVSQAVTEEAKREYPQVYTLTAQRNNWWGLKTRTHPVLIPRLRKAVSMVNATALAYGLKL